MPVHAVDSEKRLQETKLKHKDLFQQRLGSAEPPTLHEVLGLSPGEEFREKTKFSTAQGNEKSKMMYFFQGVPVMNCHIVAERNPETGEYISMMNNFWGGLADELPSGDLITAEDAVGIALEKEGDLARRDEIPDPEVELQINVDEHSLKASKLYKVSYFLDGEGGPKRPVYLVDASSKKVVDHWNNLCTGFMH